MHKNDIYIVILRPDTTRAEAPNRLPAGEIARRIPRLEAGHPHTSIARTATHNRAHSNATMRKHAPQPQTQITKAATACRPSYPDQRSTRSTRHECNVASIHPTTDPNTRQGGPTAPASTQRWDRGIFGPDQPGSTMSGCSRDQQPL